MNFCAIDFGTSNSAVALPAQGAARHGVRLAPVEWGHTTLPTAVFFNVDEDTRVFGRSAIESYIDGYDGRLMRSMKSILGSPLAEQSTELGDGSAVRYLDVIALFLHHLKQCADVAAGRPVERAVLGRPVFFVDDDPRADQLAQDQLKMAAHAVGFRHVEFQFEPIAAAFDYESRLESERLVLVADIGGGTSDFSLVRVGAQRARMLDRQSDVLGHHGVHMAGTDFDRRVELVSILRELGYQSLDKQGREVPNRIYFDLATWHLINTVYTPKRVGELRLTQYVYAQPRYYDRLMHVIDARLGHALAGLAEQAKIDVAAGGRVTLELSRIEPELTVDFSEAALLEAAQEEIRRIADAARDTLRQAGVAAADLGAVYFTGGTTGLRCLTGAIGAAFPRAEKVFGDRLASVATGLGIHAQRLFG
ncbi:hypothetical protein DFQ28_005557 [Apophysomyces sp. BC1034]|nr:hypothetical protein DFQ28_005557 [Apophysomyces sp. BC1034]